MEFFCYEPRGTSGGGGGVKDLKVYDFDKSWSACQ